MSATERPRRRWIRRVAGALAFTAAVLVTIWAAIAVAVDGAGTFAAGLLVALVIAVYWRVRPKLFGRLAAVLVLACTVVWWLTLAPRNDRAWQPDVARLPEMRVTGSTLEVGDVRDYEWTGEESGTPRWVRRTYALDQVQGVDLVLSDWGTPAVVHTIVSFEFADGSHLAISIEARKELGEAYSAWRGFFRQFELAYVVGEERDLLGVRARFRGEKLRLYRLSLSPAMARELLLTYVARIERLADDPAWYNALTTNCTTTIRLHAVDSGLENPWDWRMLVNGSVDALLYERGRLNRSMPFEELKLRSDVTQAAHDAFGSADFSARIRTNLPARPSSTNH
jgi:hypothetical protein